MALVRFFRVVGFLAYLWVSCVFARGPIDERRLVGWSRSLVGAFGVRMRISGPGLQALSECSGAMVVANHTSWLDPFLVNSVRYATFVAKREIAGWPVLGSIVKAIGTTFIERASRRSIPQVISALESVLASGRRAAFFPEGKTGDGRSLLPFHPNLLEAACRQGAPVFPVLIRYRRAGEVTDVATYKDKSLVGSAIAVLSASDLEASVTVLEPVETAGLDRHAVCRAAEARMRQAFGQ